MTIEMKKAIFSAVAWVVLMALFFTVPWFVVGLNLWGWFFVCVDVLLAIFEAISVKTKGKSLSQTFWDFIKIHPKTGIVVLSSVTIGWIILMLHLLHV